MRPFLISRGRIRLVLVAWAIVALLVTAACSTPAPTPSPSSTPFPVMSPTSPPAATASPSATAFATSTAAATPPAPSATASPTAEPTAAASPTPAPTPTAQPTATVSAEVRAKLRKIEEEVSKLRELPMQGPSEPTFLSRQELDARYQKQLDDSGFLKDMADLQDILTLFGVLQEGEDLAKLTAQMEGQNILGFFDLSSKELVIVGDSQKFAGPEEMTFAHEFTHQLQQEHFNIKEKADKINGDSEATAGFDALIEGDATLSMFNYIYRHYSQAEVQKFYADEPSLPPDIPQYLTMSMMFPYNEGFQFVASLYRDGGWAAVDRAFDSPPVSTEQIMHPDKYRKGEKPVGVDLPDIAAALGPGWEQRKADSIGEFDLKLILEQNLPEIEAARAAAGWGGDKFYFLKGPNNGLLLVSLIAWDTEKDAGEFFVAYEAALRKQGIEPKKQAQTLGWSAPGRESSLRLRGDKTLLVLAPNGDTLDRVQALFAASQ